MKRRMFGFLAVMVFILGFIVVRSSHAVLVFPTIGLEDVTLIAAGMLGLLGAVWALRKALGFLGGR